MQDSNPQQFDDLERQLKALADKFKGKFPGKSAVAIIFVFLLLFWGANSSFYQVGTEETGVILRVGKFTGFAEPGLHFKIPFNVDRVYFVKTDRVLKEEFGFRTIQAGVRTNYSNQNFDDESLTLTGDLNVSDIEWIVQYQIADPFKFLFTIKDPTGTIRDMSEAVVRRIVGNSNVSAVLTTERASLADTIESELQQTLNSYDIGVRIVTVKFQDVNPPETVKAAFNEVNEAEQQKESLIFQAREQYNREVPKARGVAKSMILEAEGYALERINQATGEADRFLSLLKEYKKNPVVTRRRIYLETIEDVIPMFDEVYMFDPKADGILPLLPLRKDKGGK